MNRELERRRFQRLEHPLDVTVRIMSARKKPQSSPQIHVKSRNISKAGICLEAKSIEVDGVHLLSGHPFERENRLHLSMEFFQGEPPLVAIGEVRWYGIDRDIPEFIFRLGVAFIQIEGDGEGQLERFLKLHRA